MNTAQDENFFPYRGKGPGDRVEIVIFFKPVTGCRLCSYFFLFRPSGQFSKQLPLGVLLTKEIDEGGAGDIEKLKIEGMFLRKGVPELP